MTKHCTFGTIIGDPKTEKDSPGLITVSLGKIRIFFLLNLLNDIDIKFETQGEFWNPLVMSFPKLSLVTWFDQLWAEKIKSKERWEIWPQLILSKTTHDLEASLSFPPIFSAHSLPNQAIKGIFGKLSDSGFQNWP